MLKVRSAIPENRPGLVALEQQIWSLNLNNFACVLIGGSSSERKAVRKPITTFVP